MQPWEKWFSPPILHRPHFDRTSPPERMSILGARVVDGKENGIPHWPAGTALGGKFSSRGNSTFDSGKSLRTLFRFDGWASGGCR